MFSQGQLIKTTGYDPNYFTPCVEDKELLDTANEIWAQIQRDKESKAAENIYW
jgi:hypothetical protein